MVRFFKRDHPTEVPGRRVQKVIVNNKGEPNEFLHSEKWCVSSEPGNKGISMAFPYKTINDFISVKPAS